MFRQMRRFKQQLTQQECEEVLARNMSGVLAVAGDDGYPYAVPMSYAYTQGKFYFHCAVSGHKLDAVMREPKASFCVVDKDELVPERFTSYFRSVIAFGKARVLEGEEASRAALRLIAEKVAPDDVDGGRAEVERTLSRVRIIEFTVEHMTGKQAIELVQKQ